ncbi:MAG: CBS domain-containing protein [Actinomycetota bacterium]|jgi:CBS domain-containing protein|nr:CBS domain-containing protein [Actinomycetota bacterium]
MAPPLIYVSRLVRLSLLGADGVPIGHLDDVVLSPPGGPDAPPRVLGFVAIVQRRKIFVNANRVGELNTAGARMQTGTVDLRRFQLRPGEVLAREGILDKKMGALVVNDIALAATTEPQGWQVDSLSLSPAGLLRRRRADKLVPWSQHAQLFDTGPMGRQVAALRSLHPAELAATIAALPPERRRILAEAMEDSRLADLLEELPEEEQVRLIESLDVERAASVLEEMEADDAADLLAELPAEERDELLEAMEPDEARPLRRLLAYEGDTAGGLMTPEPLIVTADVTVAEVLARVRDREVPAALAAQVFVVEPPTATPTGRYLGWVNIQRLLREPPGYPVGGCLEGEPVAVRPDLSELEVAGRLAAYDAIALPVCDGAGRLVGAVTVDDVLDRVLPPGWRGR